MAISKTLLLTVGTGNVDDLVRTLIDPLKKSILQGEWAKVILLPSQLTAQNADRLREELAAVPIETCPLPRPKLEDDADGCFAHFDAVLAGLLAAGATADSITADFTRGTKAMSAALVLAAVRRGLPILRYVSGVERDQRGMVVAGTEIVTEIKTTVATARRRLDDAVMFFRQGNFSAVLGLFREGSTAAWPDELAAEAAVLETLASFLAAWDRLDYSAAAAIAEEPRFVAAIVANTSLPSRFVPTREVLEWVRSLAEVLPNRCEDKADPLRRVLVDLFANGERRLRDHQYEDALLRAYRAFELLGQVRLFALGFDSAALPPDHPKLIEFQRKLEKKKSDPLTSDPKSGMWQAAKDQVARLVNFLGDDFGKRLIDEAKQGELKATARNNSVLIHGFEAKAGSHPEPLNALYERLRVLIESDLGDAHAESWPANARFPNFV